MMEMKTMASVVVVLVWLLLESPRLAGSSHRGGFACSWSWQIGEWKGPVRTAGATCGWCRRRLP